jgi:hypothetical protein
MHNERGLSSIFTTNVLPNESGTASSPEPPKCPAQYASSEARRRKGKYSYPVCGELTFLLSVTNVHRKFLQTEV